MREEAGDGTILTLFDPGMSEFSSSQRLGSDGRFAAGKSWRICILLENLIDLGVLGRHQDEKCFKTCCRPNEYEMHAQLFVFPGVKHYIRIWLRAK